MREKAGLRQLARGFFDAGPATTLSDTEKAQLRELCGGNEREAERYIAEKEAALKRLAEDQGRGDAEVELWPDMVDQWKVFRLCKWDLVAGFGAAFWTGIAATELESIARMIGVELNAEKLEDLRDMQEAASKVLNRKTEQ